MAVSMGTLPYLKKEESKILLLNMKKGVLKSEIFKDCGKS